MYQQVQQHTATSPRATAGLRVCVPYTQTPEYDNDAFMTFPNMQISEAEATCKKENKIGFLFYEVLVTFYSKSDNDMRANKSL